MRNYILLDFKVPTGYSVIIHLYTLNNNENTFNGDGGVWYLIRNLNATLLLCSYKVI